MSRFLPVHSGTSLHGICKKLLRHHQFVFLNNFISALFDSFPTVFLSFLFFVYKQKNLPFRGAGPF